MTTVINGLLQSAYAVASGTLTTTGSDQDVPGCSVTVTVTGAHAFAVCFGAFDLSKTAVGASGVGAMYVDGTALAGSASFSDGTNTISDRQMTTKMWQAALSPGTHQIKMRASRTNVANGGTVNVNGGGSQTALFVLVFDIP